MLDRLRENFVEMQGYFLDFEAGSVSSLKRQIFGAARPIRGFAKRSSPRPHGCRLVNLARVISIGLRCVPSRDQSAQCCLRSHAAECAGLRAAIAKWTHEAATVFPFESFVAGTEISTRCRFNCKCRTVVRRRQNKVIVVTFDQRQFARRPIAGNLSQRHPKQIVVAGLQSGHDVFEDVESLFFAIEIQARPVTNQYCRLAALVDDLRQSTAFQIGSNKLVD